MAIPLSQLETWSHQGPIISSKATHESIRNALKHEESPIKDRINRGSIKVYLQGSYRNDTNIRADSDVDVIVELTTTFGHNSEELPSEQEQIHEQTYNSATYTWGNLRTDIIKALTSYYGQSNVDTSGNKSIKLLPSSGRLQADIVPVINYRKYDYFLGKDRYSAEEGIEFFHQTTKKAIVNYPEQHLQNGASKHQNTQGQFKPVVRIMKNARNYLVDRGLLGKDKAPSYFLQNLVYNVPNSCFSSDLSESVRSVLSYLYTNPNSIETFICQNGLTPLFDESEESWNIDDALTTIVALADLWDRWSEI